jgi:hypothetical protein
VRVDAAKFRTLPLEVHAILEERESLAKIRNATVHAFLSTALCEERDGYRLYWPST